MKKITNFILMATSIAIVAASCKGKDKVADNPKAVLMAFFERMAAKDIDGATKLATKDSKSTMDMMKKGMEMAEKMKDSKDAKVKDNTEDFKDVEFGEAKIDGDNATVPMKNKKKDQSFDFPLKKEDGSWKVDFNMGTLMKMGMEQMGKEGKNPFDEMGSDTTGGGDMKDLEKMFNSDSLKDAMEKVKDVMKDIKPEDLEKAKEMMKEVEKMKSNQ